MSSREPEGTSGAVAVIGMAARLPGARDIEQFWQNLRDGRESITFFSDAELSAAGVSAEVLNDPAYVKASGALEGIDLFDAQFFGFNPREAEMTDPQHRLFLEEAWKALEHAGYDPQTYPHLIGVYAGVGMNRYLHNLYSNPGLIELFGTFQTIIGNDKDFLSTRVSYKLNLKGPSLTVQSACSTSLVAVHLACQSLLFYQCDMALAGGVSVNPSRAGGYFYQEGGILSPDGHCRAFDAAAQGMVAGSGVGVVVLKRLEEAVDDGDTIHAVIKGSAVNNDGSSKIGFTAPSVSGQARVIAEAQAVAGVNARTISYVEAHGTATPLGDPVEIAALTEAFRAGTDAKGFCAVGSVKTNIGHTDAAAGVAGLIKTVLALEHRELPPSLNFEKPNPQIDFASCPFYVNASLAEWNVERTPRRAGVSSLGLGGTNAHVILEEAPAPPPAVESRPWHLLLLSARTASALESAAANLAAHLKRHPDLNLEDVAYTLQVGRRRFAHRRAVICRTVEDASAALETLDPKRTFSADAKDDDDPPVVFMFPGGGAQHVNMGRELYGSEPTFRAQLDLCLGLLKSEHGCDLREHLYPGERHQQDAARHLERTSIALPLLFAVEYALAGMWMSWGITPRALIGHSLGEYVAACLSGVLTLEEALALVTLRGRLFEQLPEGAMLSVPLPEEEVRRRLSPQLSVAAVNGPSLCVVSGPTREIEELRSLLADGGVDSSRLRISVAAHSEMVAPILKPFGDFAGTLRPRPPRIPYVSDVTGSWTTQAEATDPTYWTRHLRQTVRFADGVGLLLREQNCRLLEVGPGRTLSTLARQQSDRSGAGRVFSSLPWPDDPEPETASVLRALGHLWLAGKEVDWSGFHAGARRRRVPLPTYPFEGQSYWVAPRKSSSGEADGQHSLRKKSNVDEWFYLPSWKRSRPPALSKVDELGARKVCWLLFAEADGLGRRMGERLRELNQEVVEVTAGERYERLGPGQYSLKPDSAEDYRRFIEALRASGFIPQTILHLWSLTQGAESGAEFFDDAQQRGYYSLLFLAQALEGQGPAKNLDLVVITNHLQDVSGEEQVCPEKATLLGPCQVVSQEHLNVSSRCLDITLPAPETRSEARLIDQLLAEALARAPETLVAYRGPRRLVQSYEKNWLAGQNDPLRGLREKGVYLITGGWGSVGLFLAEYLARTFKARLILLGRSALPGRGEWADWLAAHPAEDQTSRKIRKVLRLEELGAEVASVCADVADEGQMRSAFRLAEERFGEIHGVIHAAGITSGKSVVHPIAEIGYEESEAQFAAKARGLYVLEKLLAGREVDFCLLFSSNASVLGGLGAVAYSAANHFMDAFASARAGDDGVAWISANWDAWPADGSAPEQARQRSIDEYGMTPDESARAFTTVVTQSPPGQVVVSTGELAARINLWIERQFLSHVEETEEGVHTRPELETSYVAPANEVEQTIADIWQQLFGIERVGVHDDFFDLGGHSLLATRIVTRLRQSFRIQLPLRSLFDHPTVAGLAREVSRSLSETQDGQLVKVTSPHAETAQELLARIDQLPDDQIDSLLDKYTG